MSRLQDEMKKRQEQPKTVSQAEAEIRQRYEAKKASLQRLVGTKDFAVYLKIEEEMNDPKIVVAHKCSDPVCESLKMKVRDFWNRQRLLEKVKE